MRLASHQQCAALTDIVRGYGRIWSKDPQRLHFQSGEQVYPMGGPTDQLYVVISGRVRTSLVSAQGREAVLGVHGSGTFFGELCFCEVRARQEQAVALEPTEVLSLGIADLVAVAESGRSGLESLLEAFCHRIAESQQQVADLAFSGVKTRLGLLLLRLAEGALDGEGYHTCMEVLTHEELAFRVFTTREQVSAILTQWRSHGLVSYKRGIPMRVRRDALLQDIEMSGNV